MVDALKQPTEKSNKKCQVGGSGLYVLMVLFGVVFVGFLEFCWVFLGVILRFLLDFSVLEKCQVERYVFVFLFNVFRFCLKSLVPLFSHF